MFVHISKGGDVFMQAPLNPDKGTSRLSCKRLGPVPSVAPKS